MKQTFTLPDVGEGLTEAEIISWRVAEGDNVAINDVICEIETAKSVVELPSPYAGVVTGLLAAEGETVEVGAPIIEFAGDPSTGSNDGSSSKTVESSGSGATEPVDGTAAAPASGAVLVGYGSGEGAVSRRRKKASAPVRQSSGVAAKPPIRALARELGVDLAQVRPTGAQGEVTRADVLAHAEQASVFRNIETPAWGDVREETIPAPQRALDDDRVESVPVKGVRKATASAMSTSAYSAPHVSVWTDVDATRTMDYIKRLKTSPKFADVKISPLLVYAKAVLWAVQRTPMINATWVPGKDGDTIAVRHYVNLGIAAATPRGLLVPNIKDAQDLTLHELAEAIERLTITAREGKTTPADQQGGTITITNIGVFGMDAGTPIINPGEAAIVAMGVIRQKPWVVDGEVRPRWVTTVSGSFDHRIVDGDKISRFVADVASVLEEPALLLD